MIKVGNFFTQLLAGYRQSYEKSDGSSRINWEIRTPHSIVVSLDCAMHFVIILIHVLELFLELSILFVNCLLRLSESLLHLNFHQKSRTTSNQRTRCLVRLNVCLIVWNIGLEYRLNESRSTTTDEHPRESEETRNGRILHGATFVGSGEFQPTGSGDPLCPQDGTKFSRPPATRLRLRT